MEVGGGSRRRAYLLQIHRLHRPIHPFHHPSHAPRDLPHRHRRLHPTRHRIDPAPQSQEVEPLVLLADGVLSVDLGNVRVVLLDGFFEFGFLGGFVAGGAGGLTVELFGGELWERF